jgi:hypothetical protein
MSEAYPADWLGRWQQNQIGFQRMHWQGEVVVVKALDNAVVVYGPNNVTALVPFGVTFSTRELLNTGVCGRGAVGGDEQEHVFVDKSGVLYRIGADLLVTRLDYSAYLSAAKTENPVVSFDPVDREFYVSTNSRAYLLTGNGLVQLPFKVTGLYEYAGDLKGVKTAFDGMTGVRMVSWQTDLGTRSIKNVVGVHVGTRIPANVTVALQYRTDAAAAWKTTTADQPSADGYSWFYVSGVEFRVVLTESGVPSTDWVDVYWNVGGKMVFGSLY